MHRTMVSLVALASLSLCARAGGVYDGMRLVRVGPLSASQQLAVAQLPIALMSEAVSAVGTTDYLADDEDLATLAVIGVPHAVVIEDVQAIVDAERARLDARVRWDAGPAPRGDNAFFTEFRDPAEIAAFLDGLVAAHPGLISRSVIGQSVQGRPIEAYTISGAGDPDAKRSFIFHGTIHAREWISPMTVLFTMRGLVEGYATDPRIQNILDNATVRVVPVLNPDGYAYSWTDQRFWRKNRRGGYGVDLNRNFSVGWGGSGSSGSIGSETYRGDAPFSEPESRALRDFILSVPNRAAHIDFHSYSQLIMWPPGFEVATVPAPDGPALEALGRQYRDEIRAATGEHYTPQRCVDLYVASGITTDWAFWEAGVYGWTIELRPDGPLDGGGFAPPPEEILPCAIENHAGVLALAEAIIDGVVVSGLDSPPSAQPGQPVPLELEVIPAFLGTLDGVSVDLFSRTGGDAFSPTPMTLAGESVFTASLPPAACGESIEYYAEISTPSGLLREPRNAPGETLQIPVFRTRGVAADDMESDAGWTVTPVATPESTGVWELADPNPSLTQPADDHSPDGSLCWITDARRVLNLHQYDVSGVTTLTSPAFDLRAAWDEHFLSYWLWFYTLDEPLAVEVSANDGATWELLELVTDITGGWERRVHPLPEPYASSAAFRVRFVATDEGQSSLVEAAVDDLEIFTTGCGANPADLAEPFGTLDAADISAFITAFVDQASSADLAPPAGVIDLFDVVAFTVYFVQGPP